MVKEEEEEKKDTQDFFMRGKRHHCVQKHKLLRVLEKEDELVLNFTSSSVNLMTIQNCIMLRVY
jgi:hypothetical protein